MTAPPTVLFAHAGAELYGADRILIELVDGLRHRSHRVQVVLPSPGPLHAELARLGVTAYRKNLGVLRRRYFSARGLLNRACRVLSAVGYLRRFIREHGIQIVHSNTTAVFSGALAARLEGIPHVWHVHEITTRPRWFARGLARCVGLLSARAVFVSQATLDHMCALSRRIRSKAIVIHNGIDTLRAETATPGRVRAELGVAADQPLVGMVGRINWWKGQATLVDCAALLAPTLPTLRVLLVGGTFDNDDSARQQLLAHIARLRLEGVVQVQDFRSDVGNVLADLDVFVLPSTEPDPFPTVVLEAMAAGRPIVAFRHGGVCEMVVDGESGLLCTPGSVDEMAAAIARLVAAPELRRAMGDAGRARVKRLYDRDAFVDRFSELYAELVSDAGR